MELMSDTKMQKFRTGCLDPKMFYFVVISSIISYFMPKFNQIFYDGGSQQAGVNISINAFSNHECLLMLRINIG